MSICFYEFDPWLVSAYQIARELFVRFSDQLERQCQLLLAGSDVPYSIIVSLASRLVSMRELQAALDSHQLFSQTASHFGGTSFWVKGPDWLDSRALANRAAEDGVLIEPGDVFFRSDSPPLNYFRLAYSSIGESRIAEGVARLAAAVEALRP